MPFVCLNCYQTPWVKKRKRQLKQQQQHKKQDSSAAKGSLVVAGSITLNALHNSMGNPCRLGPYSNRESILLVGEGNFTFAKSLCIALGGAKIVATSLDSRSVVLEKYDEAARTALQTIRGANGKVFHDMDATLPDSLLICKGSVQRFDKVVFNFPHVGGSTNEAVLLNQNVLSGFMKALAEAKVVSKSTKSQLHITLRSTLFYDSWEVEKLGEENGFDFVKKIPFEASQFHDMGYTEARTTPAFRDSPSAENAFTYVFSPIFD